MKNLLISIVYFSLMTSLWSLNVKDYFSTAQIEEKAGSYNFVYQLDQKNKNVVSFTATFQILDAKGKAIGAINTIPTVIQTNGPLDEKRAYASDSVSLAKDTTVIKFLATGEPYTIAIKDLSFITNDLKLNPTYFKTTSIALLDNRPYLTLEINPAFNKALSYDVTIAIKSDKSKVLDTVNIKHKSPSKAYKQPIEKYSKALFDLLNNKQTPKLEITQLLVNRNIVTNGNLAK